MDIFDILTLIGGLCLFLLGMNVMGDALGRRAGGDIVRHIGDMDSNLVIAVISNNGYGRWVC